MPFDEFTNFYAYTADLTGFTIKLENIEIYNTAQDYIDENLPLNPFQHMMDNDELCVFIPEHMPYYNYNIILRELDRAGNSFTLKDRRFIVLSRWLSWKQLIYKAIELDFFRCSRTYISYINTDCFPCCILSAYVVNK